VRKPPYFENHADGAGPVTDISGARVLAKLGDSVTTDHISPAGSIKADSPAGKYLADHGVDRKDFNSYGARRGNHEVMIRGTFANIRPARTSCRRRRGRLHPRLPRRWRADDDLRRLAAYQARPASRSSSSPARSTARGPRATGRPRARLAPGKLLLGPSRPSSPRATSGIHRSNLIGMGVLPLQFQRRVTTLDDRAVEVELAVRGCERSLESWFQVVLGGFEAMPVILGLDRAAATWEIGPSRAIYRFVLPRARLMTRLRGFRRLAQVMTLVDDLMAREDEVRVLAEARARKAEEAEQAERLFRVVVQSITDVVAVVNLDGTMRFVSDAIEPVLGVSASSLFGANLFDSLVQDDAKASREVFRALAGTPESVRDFTVRVRSAAGELKTLEITAKNLVGDPRVGAFLCVARDVTARRKLEDQLAHAQRLESVGRLAGGVAHDFNNILAAVLAHAELAREGLPQNAAAREDLAAIESAARRAAELTQQLLTFARKQVIRPTVVDLNSLLASMQRLLRRVLGDDVELETAMGSPLWPVEADQGQLEQVIMNLAINARDAMPLGGRLTIETANVTFDEPTLELRGMAAGQYALLSVSDSGEGMDEATRARIFEPFFTTKDVGKGTGLGLATVYGVVTRCGGHVFVYSEPGVGTTFKIYLPRSTKLPTAEPPEAPRVTVGHGETILVVEDHDPLRQVVVRSLSQHGYRVLAAPRPREALALSEAHPGGIDLLLTDVVMPEMSGKALATALLQARPALEVVYMSGYTENTIVHHGIPDADVHFLSKPFTPSVLLAKIREVLAASSRTSG
jgi:PAS domain S-box-containing protein